MNLYEAFDVTISQDAKTFPLSEDASIDLLPVGSDLAKRKFEQLLQPYQARIKAGGTLTEEEVEKINLQFFAEVIVQGWSGLRAKPTAEQVEAKEKGDLIPYTPDAAKTLFKALPRFFTMVQRMSSDEDAYTVKQDADDAGN